MFFDFCSAFNTLQQALLQAPAVFQALVNDLRDVINHFVKLENILPLLKNLLEHQEMVIRVLQRLSDDSLFIKAKKCEFHAQSVKFVGFIIQKGRIVSDPAKDKAVQWPVPESHKQIQCFLGFANFYLLPAPSSLMPFFASANVTRPAPCQRPS